MLQDIIIGQYLAELVAAIASRPRYVVVLAPRAEVIQAREHARRAIRGKVAYKPGDQTPAELDEAFRRQTPRIGLWLDTSGQTIAETVAEIMTRYPAEAGIRDAAR